MARSIINCGLLMPVNLALLLVVAAACNAHRVEAYAIQRDPAFQALGPRARMKALEDLAARNEMEMEHARRAARKKAEEEAAARKRAEEETAAQNQIYRGIAGSVVIILLGLWAARRRDRANAELARQLGMALNRTEGREEASRSWIQQQEEQLFEQFDLVSAEACERPAIAKEERKTRILIMSRFDAPMVAMLQRHNETLVEERRRQAQDRPVGVRTWVNGLPVDPSEIETVSVHDDQQTLKSTEESHSENSNSVETPTEDTGDGEVASTVGGTQRCTQKMGVKSNVGSFHTVSTATSHSTQASETTTVQTESNILADQQSTTMDEEQS